MENEKKKFLEITKIASQKLAKIVSTRIFGTTENKQENLGAKCIAEIELNLTILLQSNSEVSDV